MKIITKLKQYIYVYGFFGGFRMLLIKQLRKAGLKETESLSRVVRRINIREIGARALIRPYTTDFDVVESLFPTTNEIVGQYDIDYEGLLEHPVKYVLDAGANIGLFTLLYHEKFPYAKIIAVEPETKNYQMLQDNLMQVSEAVCICGGIWNKHAHLRVIESNTGAWGFMVEECSEERADILGYSIQEIMKEWDIPYFDIVKMDIEGSEYTVFRDDSCTEWLSRTRVLIIETHEHKVPGSHEAVCNRMYAMGFSCKTLGEDMIFYRKAGASSFGV